MTTLRPEIALLSSKALAPVGLWTPLRRSIFRWLWMATVVSNVGTWMQDVGASWLMTSLAPAPLWVAMVQVATTLPVLLLSIPAGALADIVDRRKLLLGTQAAMGLTACVLAPEDLLGAMRAGLRYARHEPALHAVMVRGAVFTFGASVVWALLPLVARHELGLGPGLGASPGSIAEPALHFRRNRRASAFERTMGDLRRIRRRDGAIRWGLWADPAQPGRFLESFTVASWIEHMRQHERITKADRELQAVAQAFHLGPEDPVVKHYIHARMDEDDAG